MSLSRRHKSVNGPKVEINVVPLVDVSLVLLIIFMVTATFIKSAGMHIRLPSSSAAHAGEKANRELVVGIDSGGTFIWQGAQVADGKLAAALQGEARTSGTESRIIVQGDTRAPHGRVVRAMTIAQEAGFSRLVIAAQKEARKDEYVR